MAHEQHISTHDSMPCNVCVKWVPRRASRPLASASNTHRGTRTPVQDLCCSTRPAAAQGPP